MSTMAHKDIPGNPSTAKSSGICLNDRSQKKTLNLLTEEDWTFWITNDYVVIKNVVPKEQVKKRPITFGNMKIKTRMI